MPDELWMEIHDIVQEAGIKTIPKKKKGKTAVWGGLKNICEKKRSESKEEKERYLNAEFQRTAGRHKITLLSDPCKEIEENNKMGKTTDL